jgi:hypothetical protein
MTYPKHFSNVDPIMQEKKSSLILLPKGDTTLPKKVLKAFW